jgi:AcrR family transcriptional regulator
MAQVLKEEVRARIVASALEVFAANGFERATMGAIAEGAGVAVANLYRYYANKTALFDAVVPRTLAKELNDLLEGSVRGFAYLAKVQPSDTANDAAEELLKFWLQHRLAVVILLDRAEGTAYARYGERFVAHLVALTLGALLEASPCLRVSRAARFVLEQLFESTRRTIAAILASGGSEEEIRESVAAFRSYQVAGLRAFSQWVSQSGEAATSTSASPATRS